MKAPKSIILLIICGVVALFGGAGARLFTAWHASQEDIRQAFTDESAKKEDESYSALLNEQGRINILVMGEDEVEGSRRSDTILFVTVDIDDKNMRVISLPRDTRVQIPHHGTQKLNHAFAYGGPDLMKATVEKYLNTPILYYIVIDYDSFPVFVDMVGGVEIDVQKRMRYVDRAGGLDINIQPGRQLMDGETALKYVRFRKDAMGDIGRIQRQQQFIKALVKKAYDPRVIIKFPELASQAMKIFRSDMSPTLAVQLAGFIKNELGRERIFFSMLPGEPAVIDRLSYWMGDTSAAEAFLNAPVEALVSGDLTEENGSGKRIDFSSAGDDMAASRDKAAESADAREAQDDKITKEKIAALVRSMTDSIAVLNGTGKNGVSAEIASRLQLLGVDVVHSGNAKHFDYRHCNIIYPPSASESARVTARQLGVLLDIPKNLVRPSKQAFYASIIAGHDYKKLITLLDELIKISEAK